VSRHAPDPERVQIAYTTTVYWRVRRAAT
jgi:hypothetical protein